MEAPDCAAWLDPPERIANSARVDGPNGSFLLDLIETDFGVNIIDFLDGFSHQRDQRWEREKEKGKKVQSCP